MLRELPTPLRLGRCAPKSLCPSRLREGRPWRNLLPSRRREGLGVGLRNA